jgi:hypothetical protein
MRLNKNRSSLTLFYITAGYQGVGMHEYNSLMGENYISKIKQLFKNFIVGSPSHSTKKLKRQKSFLCQPQQLWWHDTVLLKKSCF